MKVKKKILYLVATAVLAMTLLLALVVLPTMAATTTYATQNFNSVPLGAKGHSGLGTYFYQRVASKAEVVIDPANPTGSNRVLKLASAVESTAALGYDALLYSSNVCKITWNSGTTVNDMGETVYTGTFPVSTATYFVESADKKTVRILDQVGTASYTVSSNKITYKDESVTITWGEYEYDYFGNYVMYGYFKNADGALFRVKSLDSGATCIVMDRYEGAYTVYNTKAVEEALNGNGTGNVDRNLVMKNTTMSSGTVVLQADYYIENDSKGVFESQHVNFTAYNDNGVVSSNKSWLNYFNINLEAGTLNPEFSVTNGPASITMEKETWNTVSLVIELSSGNVGLYLNNVLQTSGRLYKSELLNTLTLNNNSWNVAKLMKNSNGPDSYQGAMYVDNIVAHSCSSSMVKTFSTADDANGNPVMFIDVTTASGRNTGVAPGSTILVNEGVTAANVYLTDSLTEGLLAPVEGASIRLTNSSGIRYATQVNTEKLNALKAYADAGKIKALEIGTLITPTSYVKEAGAFTVEALDALNHSSNYLDVKATIGKYFTVQGYTLADGFDKTFVGSIINIRHANIARSFSGIGYVRIVLNNGVEKYIYSYDYADIGANVLQDNYSRSIAQIARVFVNNEAFAQYRDILQSFIDGTTVMNLSSSLVKNAEYSINTFYFQNAAGISMRLTYDGNNGWRMQAVKPTQSSVYYNDFDNMGAAQSLSMYLGEGYNDVVKNLTVTTESGKIKITAEGTDSYVTVNTTGSFGIQFMSANGVLMNNVTSVTSDGSSVTMKGGLLSGEAIYGGGERFDSANKRGKIMQLYTYDAFDGGGKDAAGNLIGTYTAIPLFTSTRGSGMFVNRYEIMSFDWGKTSSNVWQIDLENDLMDIYFYSTGKMTDAIKAYTDLSGHATLPEEWAQGVLICRYSPDFASLEGETMIYKTLTEIPGYETLLASANGTQKAYEKWVANGNTFANGTYIYSGELRKYLYIDTDGDGTMEFIRTTKKGQPSGAGVKAIVQGLIDAGMKPDAMVLEGLSWSNISKGNVSATKNLNNVKEVLQWLDEQGIRTTLYMGIGGISNTMLGYKEEYHLHADVIITVTQASVSYRKHNYTNSEILNTTSIPRSAASDNPDAFGSLSQNYLDITNPEAVKWYMDIVWGQLIDLGVDGCKIDFCETMPNGGSMPLTAKNTRTGLYEQVGSASITYKWYDPTVFEDDEVHHAYSSYFISEFMKSMLEQKEAKNIPDGFVALSRGGGIGSQRNPYMWGGDQNRNEVNLTTQLLCVINSGISGIPFMTYDMAGYAYTAGAYYDWDGWDLSKGDAPNVDIAYSADIESKIFLRAIQYTAFGTMIQTHGDVRHAYELELIGYEEGYAQEVVARYTQLHRDLMDYLQKYSQIACDTGVPVVRHMVLNYQNDANVYDLDDQFMMGDALMVAPILTLDTYSRSVYLPKGNWMDLLTGETYQVGDGGKTITVDAEIDQIAVFLNLDASQEDLEMLADVFNSKSWQTINRGVWIPIVSKDDPYGEDIF